jgi:hypothetical protein
MTWSTILCVIAGKTMTMSVPATAQKSVPKASAGYRRT